MTNRLSCGFGFLVGAVLMFAACGGDNGTVGNGTVDMRNGACVNANDIAIGKAAMDSAASACGLACYAAKDAMPPKQCSDCLTMKIMEATGKTLSTGCNTCWTTVIICGIQKCSAPCLQNGSNSAECRACTQMAGCDSGFTTCSGL
jgi:hypothetical protein